MNKILTSIAILVLALSFGAAGSQAFAQVYQNTPYQPPAYSTYNNDMFRAKKIIGADVKDQQGKKVGEIDDLLLDPNGRAAFAVLDPSHSMGFGHDRFVALPMNALAWNAANHDFVLNIPREKLAQAPSFDESHWPIMADRTSISGLYQYYGLTPYWVTE